MTHSDSISDEKLSAFVDDQLDANERAQLIDIARKDKVLNQRINDLRQLKALMDLSYRDPPRPATKTIKRQALLHYFPQAIAVLVLLCVGVTLGWKGQQLMHNDVMDHFQTVANFDTANEKITRVILHVSTIDKNRIDAALRTTENILKNSRAKSQKVQLEVIANAEGLGMLRQGSPFTRRIEQIVDQYDNASFLACGIAMETAKLKEGKEIQLIPAAQKIPTALDRILTRLENGWMYIKG